MVRPMSTRDSSLPSKCHTWGFIVVLNEPFFDVDLFIRWFV